MGAACCFEDRRKEKAEDTKKEKKTRDQTKTRNTPQKCKSRVILQKSRTNISNRRHSVMEMHYGLKSELRIQRRGSVMLKKQNTRKNRSESPKKHKAANFSIVKLLNESSQKDKEFSLKFGKTTDNSKSISPTNSTKPTFQKMMTIKEEE
jgi:hypothetical protein